ncbi:hypothetical protein CMO89_00195 [Candidatus Woesearchaeota archaeon]|nr:hypothetical protein [Candidatus Woesearchaeota archaeon]|tara:strand:+ start:7578 stop:8492 length:915 start_codon:yes stop_codon:yes gene_type:complete
MNKKRGLLFVLFTALVSGFSIFINRFGVSGINSSVFTFSKNIIVALFLFTGIVLVKDFGRLKILSFKQWSKLVLIGLVGGSIPFLLFFKGLQLTSGAAGSFIHKTMFVYVAVLAMLFLKERLDKRIVIPAVLLLAGNALLLKFVWQGFGVGELLILVATLFWAVENVISKHALKELEPKVVGFGRMFFGSLFILVYLSFTKQIGLVLSLNLSQVYWILLTSAFLFLYVFTWYNGLRDVKVTTATSVLLLGSPITTLLSYLFLGTALSLSQAMGLLLLLTGVVSMILFTEFGTKYDFLSINRAKV